MRACIYRFVCVLRPRPGGARRRGGAGAIRLCIWTLADRDAQGRHFTVYGIRAGTPRWLAASPSRVSRRRRYKLYRGICVQVHMFICTMCSDDWEIVCLSRPAPPRRHGNSSLKYEDTPFILKRTAPPWPEKRDWALRVPVPAGPVADSTASPHVSCANINHTQRATASARNDDGDRSAEGHNREGG